MICTRYVDFSTSPHDESTVGDAYDQNGCSGVKGHFGSNPIHVGDCIEIDGVDYLIAAVAVKCNDHTVQSDGTPPPGAPPDHTHSYQGPPVEVELWLTPA